MQLETTYIIYLISRYNPILEYIDDQDLKQEIEYAKQIAETIELSGESANIFSIAAKCINRLAKELGFSRKKGKDNFDVFYNESEFTESEQKIISDIENYYQIEDHTAAETCEKFNIEHNNKVAKLLAAAFPKFKSNRLKSKK
jgi:formyltetrahydrofolate synthetase